MSISKIGLGIAVGVMALTVAVPAFAGSKISNTSDCQFEGGTMTNVKGSDYCLVQIRPKEYSGVEYDGNQLGIVDCPGNKLNDGLFCMYPVTIRAQVQANTPAIKKPAVASISTLLQNTKNMAVDDAKKEGKNMAVDGAKKEIKNMAVDKVKKEGKKQLKKTLLGK
ncbi:MAG: hypothetical protein V3U57_08435 [Robiginitomaculum sp.]